MKNLKIGSKIMFGYGIIILLILIFSGFVIYSSISTNNNVDEIHADSELQAITNELMMHFYDARVNARTIYIKNDDESYNAVMSLLDEAQEHAQEIRDFMDSHAQAQDFKNKADAAITLLAEWKQIVDKVQQANKDVDAIVSRADVNQEQLLSQSMGIFNYQIELSTDEVSQEVSAASRLRRIDRLDFGAKLAKNIESIGSAFRFILISYDLSLVPESKQLLDETYSELESFVNDSTIPYNIETGTAVLQALDAYNNDIDEFIVKYNEREVLINDAVAVGEEVLDAITVLLNDLSASTQALTENTARTTTASLTIVIIVSIISLLFAIIFAIALTRIISRPVQMMHKAIDQAGLYGDLNFSPETMRQLNEEAKANDEIGQSMRSFITLIEHLSETGEQISCIAQGDMSIDIPVLSEKDTIGMALTHMLKSLNDMFSEINVSTAQVTVGSQQIADGAQALAQGATQQSATVQQLSSSIAEIARKTKQNADMADKSAQLAKEISDNAQRGSRQMDEMMTAVKEVNQASQSIGKVIKVIDDIAFQTNILALNAAVEAARAGQHGKGFAVVAEEVRNLAAKSAEAAKDTGSLIANSIEKAELGARIADDTAASLAQIVAGINESSKLVSDIAKSSEEQSIGIDQINRGIDQVTQVVQQNSASAQQSAAASQQMSGQSDMLEQLVARFKLKDNGMNKTLTIGGKTTPKRR